MTRWSVVALTAAVLAASAGAQAKSLQACNDEYVANRAKIDGAQGQAAFIAACRKGQEVVSGRVTSAKPAVPPATAATQPATPAKSAGEASKPAATP